MRCAGTPRRELPAARSRRFGGGVARPRIRQPRALTSRPHPAPDVRLGTPARARARRRCSSELGEPGDLERSASPAAARRGAIKFLPWSRKCSAASTQRADAFGIHETARTKIDHDLSLRGDRVAKRLPHRARRLPGRLLARCLGGVGASPRKYRATCSGDVRVSDVALFASVRLKRACERAPNRDRRAKSLAVV